MDHTLNGKALQVSFNISDLADTSVVDTVTLSATYINPEFHLPPALVHGIPG